MKSLAVLINNPAAKRSSGSRIRQAENILRSRGFSVDTFSTEKRGDAENFARNALIKKPAMIVAAGGDGTINEIVNGIAGSEVPLAILPLGTVNVLAREIGVPENINRAAETAALKHSRKIFIGKITLENVTRYFILMAGIGYDGETVFRVNSNLKKITGKGAYFFSGIKTLAGWAQPELNFLIDNCKYSGYSAIIGKASKYAGDFRVTPDAELESPFFYVSLFRGNKKSDILRYIAGIVSGRLSGMKDVHYIKAEHIKIDGKAQIQIDGDYFGKTPAKIEIAKDAIRLVYPAG